MIEVADICSRKYVGDRVTQGKEVNEDVMCRVVKLLWNSLVK